MKLFFWFPFLIFLSVRAEVLDFKVTGYKRELHSYKSICKEMGVNHALIIEVRNPLRIDCMGTVISMKDFCLKKLKEENGSRPFLRGYLNSKLGEGVCEYGTGAMVSIGCDKRDKVYCKDPLEGCEKLNKIYANGLLIDHHSFIEKDVDNVLNCYYAKPLNEPKLELSKVPLPFQEKPVIDNDIFAFDKTHSRANVEKNR